MSRIRKARVPLVTAAATAALASSLVLAAPASAHVEVEAEGARALAQNVVLSFDAESESPTTGITKLEVILPAGIAPADITYEEGPKGWKLTPTGRGYVVTGPAVKAGEDAGYAVVVRQLPKAESLAFKTLQTYSDGRVDRWIELEQSHGAGHGNSAPVLKLAPAAPGAEAVPATTAPAPEPTTAAPTTNAPATNAPSATSAPAPAPEEEEPTSNLGLMIGGIAVLVVAATGAWWWNRRKAG